MAFSQQLGRMLLIYVVSFVEYTEVRHAHARDFAIAMTSTQPEDMATTTTSTAIIASMDTGSTPKRVILRLRVNKFEGEGRS